MPDHVHLILHPRSFPYDIASIRKAFKSPVARRAINFIEEHSPGWIPRITRIRAGKSERMFWQSGGGFDRNITESRTLGLMIDYIHLNPVRKRLVNDPLEWKWSSARTILRNESTPLEVDPIPEDHSPNAFAPDSGGCNRS